MGPLRSIGRIHEPSRKTTRARKKTLSARMLTVLLPRENRLAFRMISMFCSIPDYQSYLAIRKAERGPEQAGDFDKLNSQEFKVERHTPEEKDR